MIHPILFTAKRQCYCKLSSLNLNPIVLLYLRENPYKEGLDLDNSKEKFLWILLERIVEKKTYVLDKKMTDEKKIFFDFLDIC